MRVAFQGGKRRPSPFTDECGAQASAFPPQGRDASGQGGQQESFSGFKYIPDQTPPSCSRPCHTLGLLGGLQGRSPSSLTSGLTPTMQDPSLSLPLPLPGSFEPRIGEFQIQSAVRGGKQRPLTLKMPHSPDRIQAWKRPGETPESRFSIQNGGYLGLSTANAGGGIRRAELATLSFPWIGCAPAALGTHTEKAWGLPRPAAFGASAAGDYFPRRMHA